MRAWFDRFARWVTHWAGSSQAFLIAILLVIIWGLSGPYFDYSNTWQLVINTGTTIITFLMVFVIQQAQNREMLAVHIKLNEIVAALKGASNRVLNIEDMTDEQVQKFRSLYEDLVKNMCKEDVCEAHSVEEVCEEDLQPTGPK
jgi:low affinity Fe/Cu permease